MTRIRTTVAAVEQMATINHAELDRRTFVVSVNLGDVVYWAAA